MLFVSPYIGIAFSFLSFVVGLCVGSFINCAALRRQTGKSVLVGRSECPHCSATLGAFELIPLVSWAVQGARCKHCGHGISVRYPVTELISGLIFALIVFMDANSLAGLSVVTLEKLILVSILFYASLVDLDSRIIPNGCIVAALLVHLTFIFVAGVLLHTHDLLALVQTSVVGALALSLPLLAIVWLADRVFKRPSMGGGDLKLFGVAGFIFGWQQGFFLVFFACLFGIVGSAFYGLYAKRKQTSLTAHTPSDDAVATPQTAEESTLKSFLHQQIPFGPAIACAYVLIMLIGQELIWWYSGLLY